MKILLISIFYSQIIWGPDVNLTPGNDTMIIYHPRAIAWKDTIHVVYYVDLIGPDYDIFYMRSVDKGETWEGPFNLTINDPDEAILPWITCWGNKVHVVYQCGYGDSIMYIRSLDGGNTWENPRILIKPAGCGKIICRHDSLYVVVPPVYSPAYHFTRMRKSFDGGTTWTPIQQIDTHTSVQNIKISFSYLHICAIGWEQDLEIYYLCSPDLGNTWEGPFVISPVDNWSSVWPVLAVSDSNVYISWLEGMYCPFGAWFNINLRKSNDNGNSFLPRESLTNVCRGFLSDIYSKDSIVVLVWMDERDNPGQSEFELYWRASYDYGNNWTEEERLTYASGNSEWPCLAGWGNEIYLFWVEEDFSLYFKKGIYINIEESEKEIDKNSKVFSFSSILFLPAKIKFFVKNGEKYFLDLFNLNGMKINTLKRGIGKGEEEIILKDIQSGNYFLILKTKDKVLKRKILILEGGKR